MKTESKPRGKVKIVWSPEFAYAIGLLVTDGNLSSDRRHLNFTTKDSELAATFKQIFSLTNKIGRKSRGYSSDKKYYVIQFGDVEFYRFLVSIGLMANKSKIIGAVKVPDEYFYDFLRGHLDGDGSFYSYFDPRWKSSFMFYLSFISASHRHILWIQREVSKRLQIKGHITKSKNNSAYQLKYAKADSLKLLPKVYYDDDVVCLGRKRKKIEKALKIVGKTIENARVLKLVDKPS